MTAPARPGEQKPLVERAGRAAYFNAVFFPLKVLIAFASSVVVVRLLRIEGFYLLNVTTSLLNFLGLFADLGIERSLPRFYPEIEMRYGRRGLFRLLFWVAAIKGAVLLVLLSLLAIARDFWVESFELGSAGGWLLAAVGVLLVFGALSDITIQFLYTHFRQKATNALDVLAAVIYPSLTASFVLLGWGVLGAMLALVITTVASSTISLVLAWSLLRSTSEDAARSSREVNIPSNRPLRNRLVSFSALNYLISWTAYLYDLPFLVLTITLVYAAPDEMKAQVAIISLAYKFTKQFLRALVVPLTGVQTPLFARLYAEGRIEGLKTAYSTITKFLILGLVPACVGLIVLARNVLQLVYMQIGEDAVLTIRTMGEAVASTAILAVGLFGESLIGVALSVLMVYESHRAVVLSRLLTLTSIPLLALLVPTYGAVGAAAAAAAAGLVSRVAALASAQRLVGVVFPAAFFVKVGMSAALMGAALAPMLLLPVNIPVTIAMLLAGLALFYGAFKLLGGMDAQDKERFRSLRVPLIGYALRFL